MPIMTAGMAAIPAAHTSSGTTLNNLAQRISGSLGLAAMTVIADNRQSQLMADRSALLPAHSNLPQVQHTIAQGTSALYGLYQQLLVQVTAAAYSDVFFATALVTGLGVIFGLVLRTQKAAPPPAEPITPRPAEPPRQTQPPRGAAPAQPPRGATPVAPATAVVTG